MPFPTIAAPTPAQAETILQNAGANAGAAQPTGGLSQIDYLSWLVGELMLNVPGAVVVLTTGSIKSSGPTAGVGYATGAGGAVTQATNKTTGVTLAKMSGAITLNNAALAAGAEATFTVANTAIAAGDVVICNHASAGTSGSYAVVASNIVAATSFDITVSNLSAGSLSEAIVINYVVIRGVSA